MSRSELVDIFKKSKLFVDFGHHPGRERMVREAAACGCCVITNTRGSARNSIDIPIPSRFKINDQAKDFKYKFIMLVNDIFENFDSVSLQFDAYRHLISQEPEQLRRELEQLFI